LIFKKKLTYPAKNSTRSAPRFKHRSRPPSDELNVSSTASSFIPPISLVALSPGPRPSWAPSEADSSGALGLGSLPPHASGAIATDARHAARTNDE